MPFKNIQLNDDDEKRRDSSISKRVFDSIDPTRSRRSGINIKDNSSRFKNISFGVDTTDTEKNQQPTRFKNISYGEPTPDIKQRLQDYQASSDGSVNPSSREIIEVIGNENVNRTLGLSQEEKVASGMQVKTTPKSVRTRLEDLGEGIFYFGKGVGNVIKDPATNLPLVWEGLTQEGGGFERLGTGLLQTTARTGNRVVQMATDVTEKMSEAIFLDQIDVDYDDSQLEQATESFVDFANLVSGTSIKRGENLQAERMLEALEAGETPMSQKGPERFADPEFLARDIIGQNLPTLAASYLSGGIAKKMGGSALSAAFSSSYLIESGFFSAETHKRLSESDDPVLQRLAENDAFVDSLSSLVGIFAGGIDAVPAANFANREVGRKVIKEGVGRMLARGGSDILQQAVQEAGTEPIQEFVANAATRIYDENQNLFEGIPEAAAGGFLLGGGTTVTTRGFQGLKGKPAGLSIQAVEEGDGPGILGNTYRITDKRKERSEEAVREMAEDRAQELENQGELSEEEQSELIELRNNADNPQRLAQLTDSRLPGESRQDTVEITLPNDPDQLRDIDQLQNLTESGVELSALQRLFYNQLQSANNQIRRAQENQEDIDDSVLSKQIQAIAALQAINERPRDENDTDPDTPTRDEVDRMINDRLLEAIQNEEQDGQSQANIAKLQELKLEANALVNSVENHRARSLYQYTNQDGILPATQDEADLVVPEGSENFDKFVEFANNGEQIVSNLGFNSVESAQEALQDYMKLRERMNMLNKRLSDKSFSANQLLQRVRQSGQSGFSRGRKVEGDRLVREFRKKNEVNNEMIDDLRSFAKEFLTNASDKQSAMTRINNVTKAKKLTTKNRKYIQTLAWMENKAYIADKKRLQKRIKEKIKKIIKSPSVDIEYKKQAEQLVKQIDLKGRTEKTVKMLRGLREYVEEQSTKNNDATQEMSERSLSMLERAYKKPFNETTVSELENILEKITRLEKLGRLKEKTRQNIWEAEKRRMLENLSENTVGIKSRDITERKDIYDDGGLTQTEKMRNHLNGVLNRASEMDKALLPMDVIFDMIDGAMGTYDGENYNSFKRTIDSNWMEYQSIKGDVFEQMEQKIEEIGIDPSNKTTWNRIGFVAAREQEDGNEKLENLGYTEQEISSVELTNKEREMLNWMRNQMEGQFDFVQTLMRELFNEDVIKVDNYFSYMTDWEKMDKNSNEGLEDSAMPRAGAFQTKKPEHGMTKSRTGAGDQKIKLDALQIFKRHMDQVAYLRAMGRDLKMLFEIANTDQYAEVAGDVGQSLVLDWLDVVARKGQAGNQEYWLDTWRKNVSVGILGLKLSTIFIQPSAFFDGAGVIGVQYATQGATRISTNKKWRKLVMSFPEMIDRTGGEVGIEELSDDNWWENLQKKGYAPMQKIDQYTAMSIAAGAYQRKMDELGEDVDFNNMNEEALEYAQFAVRRSQAASGFKDVPLALSSGRSLFGSGRADNKTINRTVLQFMTFLLNQWSRIRYDAIQVGWNRGMSAKEARGKLAALKEGGGHSARILALSMAAIIAGTGLRMAERRITDWLLGKDDDDEEENEILKTFIFEASGRVPFLGNVMSMVNYGGAGVPVVDMLSTSAQGFGSMVNGKKLDTRLRGASRFLTGATTLLGVPGSLEAQGVLNEVLKDTGGPSVGGSGGGGLLP